MKDCWIAALIFTVSATVAQCRYQGLNQILGRQHSVTAALYNSQPSSPPVVVRIEFRIGTLTIHAGDHSPLYSFHGADGRSIDCVNLATIREFDPELHTLIDRCSVNAGDSGTRWLIDASLPGPASDRDLP